MLVVFILIVTIKRCMRYVVMPLTCFSMQVWLQFASEADSAEDSRV